MGYHARSRPLIAVHDKQAIGMQSPGTTVNLVFIRSFMTLLMNVLFATHP